MGDPELYSDESVILTTPDVFIKSLPFEAILTNKRIILVDRKKNLIPPKDILLATVRDVEPGENAIRDQIITLSIITSTGDSRQMVFTFSRQGGGNRKRERDEWVKVLRDLTSSTLQKAIRKVVPSFDLEPKKTTKETIPPRVDVTSRTATKKEIDGAQPIKKIVETSYAPPKPVESTSLPYGSFCSRCGNRVPPESTYCNRCGAKIITPVQEAGEGSVIQKISPPVPTVAVPPVERRERPIEQEIRSIEPLIEGSVPKTEPAPVLQSQTTRTSAPAPVEPPLTQQSAPPPTRTTKSRKTKRSIWPQIFKRKNLPQQQVSPGTPVSPPPHGGSASGPRRRTFITIVAIVIIIIAIAGGTYVFMKGIPVGSGGSGAVEPTATSHPPTAGPPVIVPTQTPATIPANGVWVRVDYLGSWQGSYGKAGDLIPAIDSGVRQFQIENPNSTIQASFQKQDGSSHELVVEIYKNGAVIKRGTTTAPKGSVEISADPMMATPLGTTMPVTTTGTQKAGNATATPTTRPTTPVANVTTTTTHP
jgi:hypothetical protein